MTQSWEVIVVGAGSAGAAFAARLAEAGRRVLLLEAGRDYRSADVPPAWRSWDPILGVLSPDRDEYIWPTLQSSRTERQEQRLYWRGRGVGGSSAVNGIIAIRPTVEDFDDWAADGCAGWAFDDVLPYLCKLEDDLDFGSAPYHGDHGPTPVSRPPLAEWGATDLALRAAAIEHGFPWAEDVNAPGATGVSPYPNNSRDRRRVTTNDAYLEAARGLPTLEIRGGSLVDRVLIEGGRAAGVVLAGGEELRADEVVLSGGVIGSPSILMRSGIGPAEVLGPLGIAVRQDLPVGRNLQDHAMCMMKIRLRSEYWRSGSGRHTNCAIRYSSGLEGHPNDMMLLSFNHGVTSMQDADVAENFGALGSWVNRAFSQGAVEITSTDPDVQPLVRANMLSDERDVRRLRDGVRLAADLLATRHFADICDGDPWSETPELRSALDASDAVLDDYLRRESIDTAHGTSTCRMGSPDDARTVVDPACRVLGVAGLSVVDASVFPFSPRSNTHLVSVMTGEVMADRFP